PYCFAPVLTQSSDEFFLTASNQIVKDLRTCPRHYEIPETDTGLETCANHRSSVSRRTNGLLNFKKFEKNQTGRPYSASEGGPSEVLLPFLARDPFVTHPKHVRKASDTYDLQFRRLAQNNIREFRAQVFLQEKFGDLSLKSYMLLQPVGNMCLVSHRNPPENGRRRPAVVRQGSLAGLE
ncbi:MAG TPA: hypothetical protein VGH38_06265, partial [Bryobacteraceae bacterium]